MIPIKLINIITQIAEWAGSITTICAAVVLFIRPLRERVLGTKYVREGQKCLLRADMLRTYYRHRDDEKIRQYELENFLAEYQAYRALHGNSFMVKVHDEVVAWDVIT